jgi:hypothetical protein
MGADFEIARTGTFKGTRILYYSSIPYSGTIVTITLGRVDAYFYGKLRTGAVQYQVP